jgi:hypothetical protein
MRRIGLVGVAVVALLLTLAAGAWAAPVKLCIPTKEGKSPVTPKAGVCRTGYTLTELPGEEETKLLEHEKFIEKGVGGKPTIQFSGVNVQIVNGEAMPFLTNGEGNLMIGQDLNPRTQTGSENLILGDSQEYTSSFGILAGFDNTISGPYDSVVGGLGNLASGDSATVSGGQKNQASGWGASVGGGESNHAEGQYSSIFGGKGLTATGEYEAIP